MITTNVFAKNINAFNKGYKRIGNMGGQWSTKTFSILQILFLLADKRRDSREQNVFTVMSESFPHLKLGAMRSFDKILKAENQYDERNINFSEHAYHFGNAIVEFIAADKTKATGPRRNILFLNEVNHIPLSAIEAAEDRTEETIFYDWNPTAQFWFEDKVMSRPENERILIKSNYKDGIGVIPADTVREIEFKASRDPNFKRVHIDVEYGENKGLIFPNFTVIPEEYFPITDKRLVGIDFGFTNDPTAIIDVRYNNGELWLHEVLYRTQMTNSDIIKYLKANAYEKSKFVADSAEPKSIEELRRAGLNIQPAVKGADSVNHGIDLLKRFEINVTNTSVNLIKELRNYRWKEDKDGNSLNEPADMWNHGIDALRYAGTQLVENKGEATYTFTKMR